MYLVGAQTKIFWELGATASVITAADLDLLVIDPEGVEVYLDSAILAADFTAPTESLTGSASYTFTPNIEGIWTLRLVMGNAGSYTQLSKVQMYVLDNSTVTNPAMAYLKTLVTSEAIKLPCVVATTAEIVLSGLQTVNTVVLEDGDRVLVKDQTDTTENGIYDTSAGAWLRATDFDEDTEISNGVFVLDTYTGFVHSAQFAGDMDLGVTGITFNPLGVTSDPLPTVLASIAHAKEWADKAEDSLVSVPAGGDGATDYSALHWAAKAAADRVITDNNATLTSDDAAAAEVSRLAAEVVGASVLETYDNFDDRYLGAKAVDPALDNGGNALIDGAIYWNTATKRFRAYDLGTTSWYYGDLVAATDAANIVNTPAGNIVAVKVQAAINELDTEKAKLAGDAAQTFSVAAAVDVNDALNQNTMKSLFGIGGYAVQISDWNDAIVPGALYASSSATTDLNTPAIGWLCGRFDMPFGSANYGIQHVYHGAIPGANVRHYIRTRVNSVWDTNWTELPRINGDAAQAFSVAPATAAAHAVRKDQLGDVILKTKVIDIGAWNMDTTGALNKAHGLSASALVSVRSVSVVIRNDEDTGFYNLERSGTAYLDSSNVVMNRDAAGFFDNAAFTFNFYTRGSITIQYVG